MIEKLSLNSNLDYFESLDSKDLATMYFRHLYKRVHTYKFNFLGMITGKHRVGKSLTALSMAHVLDPTFIDNLEQRVVYFPSDFMTALQSLKSPESGKPIIGGAIIWDEAGIGIPAREWYETSNKSISYVLQVFGRYRPIVFFVTQDVHYIDSQARKLFHGFYELTRLKNKYAICRAFDVRYNKRSSKIYYVYSRLHMRNEEAYGNKLVLKKIRIIRPFKEMEVSYEHHSKIFKDKIVEQMQERASLYKKGKIDAKRMTIEEIIATLISNKTSPRYLTKRSKPDNIIFDKDTIRFEFKVPDGQARHIKRRAEIEVNKIPEEEQILEELPDKDNE